MAAEPPQDAPMPFEAMLAFNGNLAPYSAYRKAFLAAADVTSKEDTTRNQSIKYLRQAAMYQCASDVLTRNVPGDFIECGCFRGQSTHILASLLKVHGPRPLLVFDSFEGLSEFKEADLGKFGHNSPERQAKIRKHFASDKSLLVKRLEDFEGIEIYPGWIPARFNEVVDRTFAFAHVDVDLYEPVRDSLEFIYPRLAPRGWIVVDDYNAVSFPGANAAVDEFVRAAKPHTAIPGQIGGFLISK